MWRWRRGYVLGCGCGCGSKWGQRLGHGWGLYGWGHVNMNWGGGWRCWRKCWLRWRCKWGKRWKRRKRWRYRYENADYDEDMESE